MTTDNQTKMTITRANYKFRHEGVLIK